MVAVDCSAEGLTEQVGLKSPHPGGQEQGSFQKRTHCSPRDCNNGTC